MLQAVHVALPFPQYLSEHVVQVAASVHTSQLAVQAVQVFLSVDNQYFAAQKVHSAAVVEKTAQFGIFYAVHFLLVESYQYLSLHVVQVVASGHILQSAIQAVHDFLSVANKKPTEHVTHSAAVLEYVSQLLIF